MIIVIATIYALMVPAITLVNELGLYCGEDEHEHSSSCYAQNEGEAVCGKREHIHSLACQSNPDADVETPEEYSQAVSKVELIGLFREDILAIAESQLGYTESKLNFEVSADGETKNGYTRYGEWYGDKYGDWSGSFVSFCLNYAKVENSLVSYEADHERRISQLKKRYLYHSAKSDYVPREGDLIFFDLDKYKQREENKRVADRVGFVYKLIYDENKKLIGIKVIEGDYENRVAVTEYSIIDDSILGYGKIPDRDIKISACDCTAGADELCLHEKDCSRLQFAEKLASVKSAGAIAKLWSKLPDDVKAALDEYLAKNDVNKRDELAGLVALLPQISEKVASVGGLDFSLTGPFLSSMQASVSDISGSKLDGLTEYLNVGTGHLVSGAYDISVVDGESKAYFNEPIQVMISGLDFGKIDTKNLRVKVYHFVGVDENGVSDIDKNTEVEMMYATLDEEGNLCFETEDFSVFYFTVDFHFDGLTYVIEGGSTTTLSKLFASLELPFNSADAVKVEFSEPQYLATSPIYNENGEITDWELTSLAPFTTKESLAISFKDGSTLTIDVTDSQVPEYTTENTTTVNVKIDNLGQDVSVTATLIKNGVSTGQTVTLSSSNSYTASFTNLEPATYTVEYDIPGGALWATSSSGKEEGTRYEKATTLENGGIYVLVHDSNRAIQNSSNSTSLSRATVSISDNRITGTVSNNIKWLYNGTLQNVGSKNYLQLTTSSSSGSAKASSSVANQTSYTSGKITQNIDGSVRAIRYNSSWTSSGYRSDDLSDGDSITLYKEITASVISYEIMLEYMGFNPDENAADFEHNKEIDYLNDGTANADTDLSGEDYYRLYLDMTGKQEPMDLLIVVDGSGSMTVNNDMVGNMRRDDAVTEFLNGSTTSVTNDGFISYFLGLNSENMVSVVQFYGGVDDVTIGTQPSTTSTDVDYTHDSEVLLDWTGTAKFVDCEGREANGTNYEAGLRRATETLGSPSVRGNGHRKIMIFLSDGVPTFFQIDLNDVGFVANYPVYSNNKYTYYDYTVQLSDVGKRFGHGWSYDFTECKDTSKRAFDDFMASNPGVRVFTIGVSDDISAENTDESQHPEVLQYMAEQGGGDFYSVESDMHDLKLQLETIFYPQGVIIKDDLSKYVRYYGENPDVLVTMTHRETNAQTVLYKNGAVTAAGEGILQGVSYVAGDTADKPTASTGSVIATFASDYQFSPDYTYEVSFNVKTTATAYNEFAESGYNEIGDDNTDFKTNTTSSLKPGFHSNDKATAIYQISGVEKESEYLHPVVQVETDSLGVQKEWADSLETDSHAAIQVQLMLNHTVDGVTTKTPIGDPVTLSANNGWIHTFEDIVKYQNFSNEYSYTVEEVNVPDGYEAKYSYVNDNGLITWVVTNSVKGSLMAQKINPFGEIIPIAGITFEVYANEAMTEFVGSFETDANGKLTIDGLADGKDYWIIETVGPPGYKPMDTPQQFRIVSGAADGEILINNKYLSVDENGMLLIKNFSGYELPETGSAGIAIMYGLGILLTACAVIGGYMLKLKGRRSV